MSYPAKAQVNAADRRQICMWFESLPGPTNARQKAVFRLIADRYVAFGGANGEIRREIATMRPPPVKNPYDLSHAPRSLLVGANPIHLERVFELFQRVRGDCDAVAATLKFRTEAVTINGRKFDPEHPKDHDGLAAVKFLAEMIIAEVQRERAEQQKAKPSRQPRRKSGPHKATVWLPQVWDATYDKKKEYLYAKPATLSKWIAELDDDLRLRKTKAGKALSPSDLRYLRGHRDRLAQRLAAIEGGKVKISSRDEVRQFRRELSERLIATKLYGKPRGDEDASAFIEQKVKRAKKAIRKK